MKKIIGACLALVSAVALGATTVPIQLLNPTGSTSGQTIVSTGASSAPAWGGVGVNGIGAIAANTVLANATGGSASPTAFAMPSCSSTTSALQWTSGTGFTCDTGIAPLASPTFTGTVTVTNITASGSIVGFPGRLLNVQVFTSSGTYTPSSGQGHAIVEVQCAGGGSGGTATTTTAQTSITGGGGSGGYARVYFGSLSSVAVTIGAGGTAGTGGASPTAGGTGGTTSFGTLISCTGATGSVAGTAVANTTFLVGTGIGGPGPAPTISGGVTLLTIPGGYPATRQLLLGNTTNGQAGPGANSMLGQGGVSSVGSANPPSGYGAGAGGDTIAASATGINGAAGGGAIITVYEYQ